MTERKFIYLYDDREGRAVFKDDAGEIYVDVEGELHTVTDEGEPMYPIHIPTPDARYYYSDFTHQWHRIFPGHRDYEMWGVSREEMKRIKIPTGARFIR